MGMTPTPLLTAVVFAVFVVSANYFVYMGGRGMVIIDGAAVVGVRRLSFRRNFSTLWMPVTTQATVTRILLTVFAIFRFGGEIPFSGLLRQCVYRRRYYRPWCSPAVVSTENFARMRGNANTTGTEASYTVGVRRSRFGGEFCSCGRRRCYVPVRCYSLPWCST